MQCSFLSNVPYIGGQESLKVKWILLHNSPFLPSTQKSMSSEVDNI